MPNHPQHNAYDVQVFGCPYGAYQWVHEMLDSGYAKIFGKKHRRILHDLKSVEVIRQVFGDDVALVATHHIFLDSPTKYNIVNGRLVKNMKRRGSMKNDNQSNRRVLVHQNQKVS